MADPFSFALIPPGGGVLCALSGGADSMYLLCRLLDGRERYSWTVQAAHLNHGLRLTAQRDEDFVRSWCARHSVPLTVGTADAATFAAREGLGVEEAGRTLRYAFLEETARQEGLALIATGHHAGDNAETVLMNLIRGCGLHGLTGIPERRGNIVRPMLNVTRREIEDYLKEHGVPHVEDETNTDPAYTRNRVRLQLLPLLEQLNPQAAAHIAAAARRLREDEQELSRQAALAADQALDVPEGVAVNVQALRELPRPIALRTCAQLLDRAGLGGEAIHLEQLLRLAQCDDPLRPNRRAGGQRPPPVRAAGVFHRPSAPAARSQGAGGGREPLGELDHPLYPGGVSGEGLCQPRRVLFEAGALPYPPPAGRGRHHPGPAPGKKRQAADD